MAWETFPLATLGELPAKFLLQTIQTLQLVTDKMFSINRYL